MTKQKHKAGFVSIIGKPNVGKSTLMNQLVGERLSIITSKAQTTRHRILGIVNGDDFQIVYSDTPGIIKPQYELHQSMMRFVNSSLEDADLILFMVELGEKYNKEDEILTKLTNTKVPVVLVINKIDQAKGTQLQDKLTYWKDVFTPSEVITISALNGTHVKDLFGCILSHMPNHPPYFPKDELTDKPERFFVAEMIREKIFLNYKQEIPYSSEVVVTEFKEDDKIIRIRAEIFVERKTQKGILIGKNGSALKKVGTEARAEMEAFFGKKVFLETFVKVEPDWRSKSLQLRRFGYKS